MDLDIDKQIEEWCDAYNECEDAFEQKMIIMHLQQLTAQLIDLLQTLKQGAQHF